MKNISNYILEKLSDYTKLPESEYINNEDLLKFCIKTLDKIGLTAKEIDEEISKYDGFDELDLAHNPKELPEWFKFEDTLYTLLDNDNKYKNKKDKIIDEVWINIYELIDTLCDLKKAKLY